MWPCKEEGEEDAAKYVANGMRTVPIMLHFRWLDTGGVGRRGGRL
jgi:hypothetical protein